MNTNIFTPLEVWFVVGSQHLYGLETLAQVTANSGVIAEALNSSGKLPVKVVLQPTVKTPDEIYNVCQAANSATNCIGLIFWMHTFSPAKMWIAGLQALQKPFVQLHTKFNAEIPWSKTGISFRAFLKLLPCQSQKL